MYSTGRNKGTGYCERNALGQPTRSELPNQKKFNKTNNNDGWNKRR
jgi:hypothetical protein